MQVVYWVVVGLVSLALLVALVMFLESRDESELREDARGAQPLSSPSR